ncbi:MAG: glycosyltransferase [Nitrospiraceae bacterium]|nr:glycosyltransferase [Nitrospiraceae bacterium]
MGRSPARSRVKASLITTVHNEARHLEGFLESIASQSVLPEEVVITDGGSTDGTVKIIRDFMARNGHLNMKLLCAGKRTNIAAGRNMAIRASSCDVIAVTDAGCILEENWLYEITAPLFDGGPADTVGGWYGAVIENGFHKKTAQAVLPLLKDIDPEAFLPSSRSIAFRRSCWEQAGGYPEGLTMWAEDTLFDLRLKRTGCRFTFNPKAKVHWRMRDNQREALRQFYHYGYGDGEAGLFTARYLARMALLLFPPLLALTKKGFSFWGLRYQLYAAQVLGWTRGRLKKRKKFL